VGRKRRLPKENAQQTSLAYNEKRKEKKKKKKRKKRKKKKKKKRTIQSGPRCTGPLMAAKKLLKRLGRGERQLYQEQPYRLNYTQGLLCKYLPARRI